MNNNVAGAELVSLEQSVRVRYYLLIIIFLVFSRLRPLDKWTNSRKDGLWEPERYRPPPVDDPWNWNIHTWACRACPRPIPSCAAWSDEDPRYAVRTGTEFVHLFLKIKIKNEKYNFGSRWLREYCKVGIVCTLVPRWRYRSPRNERSIMFFFFFFLKKRKSA